MLLDIREKVRNSKPIKYTLITLICIPFALVGIGSYFSGGTAAPVAEVNGVEISTIELDRAASEQRARLAQMFGGQLPAAFANEANIRQQALDQLVTAQVMRGEVEKQKFAVGDATLAKEIQQVPAFQVDGQFDSSAYSDFLRSRGLSAAGFEQSLRQDAAINQFREGIASTSFVLPQETAKINALSAQTRTVDILRFEMEKAQAAIEVSDEDVQIYFDENADNYQWPERAKLQYISLSYEALAAAIDVSDDEAKAYYEENIARYVTPAQREASHILLAVDDRGDEDAIAEKTEELNQIKQRIADGEDFAEIAKTASEDVGSAEQGGSLGVITAGAMVPEFEEAVNALVNVGDISEPIVTDFGVHLIKLDTLTDETSRPFEDAKEEVIAAIKNDRTDIEYSALREILTEQLFENPESLEPAADESGLELQTSDWVDINSTDPILGNPQVLTAAFSEEVLDNGDNSDLIELSRTEAVAIRVIENEGPRPKEVADVSDEIKLTLKAERAGEQLDVLLKAALEDLSTGKSAEEVAVTQDLATASMDEELTRQSTSLDSGVLSSVYALAKPEADSHRITDAVLGNGDRVAVLLKSVVTPDAEEPEEPTNDGRLGGTEFSALLESLRDKADIELDI